MIPLTITDTMAAELAEAEGVCVRPLIRRVTDQESGEQTTVGIRCGATLESKCPSCARRARTLRMHQCSEGWHLAEEPERAAVIVESKATGSARRVRSTKRREDVPDLPERPMDDRTVGTTFAAPDGRIYRPSMFLTLTLPSYGAILPGTGAPRDPSQYDYRRAALDALLFPRLVDQFWKCLRRCAGYNVQYFSAIEPQKRLAPHLHAAIRGAIPRALLRQVIDACYLNVWWPSLDEVVYPDIPPKWTEQGYADPLTGELLPSWDEALDAQRERPAHVMRFGAQADIRGIIAPSEEADRAVRYLVKYLNKGVAEPFTDTGGADAYERHIDRLHEEIRWLPCSSTCPNWLRYGVQPEHAGPGLVPGRCTKKHHDREHLGLGGRRVLVSRKWSGKSLARHRADRAAVVRAALDAAGITAPDVERLAVEVKTEEGNSRYVWEPVPFSRALYVKTILNAVMERCRWKDEYDRAKVQLATSGDSSAVPP